MKNFFTISAIVFLVSFSLNVLSESYICKLTIPPTTSSDVTLYETHLFERDGDTFKHSEDYRERESFKIIRETDRYILLHRDLRVVMIKKDNGRIGQYWINVPQNYKPDFGTCSVKVI